MLIRSSIVITIVTSLIGFPLISLSVPLIVISLFTTVIIIGVSTSIVLFVFTYKFILSSHSSYSSEPLYSTDTVYVFEASGVVIVLI